MSWLGSLIGAAGSIFGGLLGKSSQDKATEATLANAQLDRQLMQQINTQNIQEARRVSNLDYNRTHTAAEIAWQRSVRQENSKIQRLVADAKKAGIHPLAALGSNASSYMGSPVSPTFSSPVGQATYTPPPVDFSAMGQNPMGEGIAGAMAALANGLAASDNSRLVDAQIRNLDADTAATLMSATSRSQIAASRRFATSGSSGGSGTGSPVGGLPGVALASPSSNVFLGGIGRGATRWATEGAYRKRMMDVYPNASVVPEVGSYIRDIVIDPLILDLGRSLRPTDVSPVEPYRRSILPGYGGW